MNRTQRAVKRTCHKALNAKRRTKHEKLYERNEAGWKNFEKKSEELKAAVTDEKKLKIWHRKMVQDYAVKNSAKEIKTA